jgi:TolA-binding protein
MQRKPQFRMELMRYPLLALLLITTATVPAFAQSGPDIDRRVDTLERELRAVQRRVFPNGVGALPAPPLTPEISPADTANILSGVPATSALADVAARLDALEGQLRSLTGQAEENAHRVALMEKALADFRTATEGRLTAIEKPAVDQGLTSSDAPPTKGNSSTAATASGTAGDLAEAAYLEGYKLWSAGKFAQAQTVLEAMVKKYPKHPRSSFAQNLLGRAYLDGGKPAAAAKIFLANYEGNRNGERAPDSLFYLGQALVRLNQPANACKVYDELESVYGAKLRGAIKEELPKARATAKCH